MIFPLVKLGFSGSYLPEDVTFLLKPVEMPPTPVEIKESLIQSGRKHYSEMIGAEAPPPEEYMQVFRQAFLRNRRRLGRDIALLARTISEIESQEITLVSLARAGTPIGVILRRALMRMGREVKHYSISIIRDRGIDTVALDYILKCGRDPESIIFIDGWTGKGAIASELERAIADYNASRKTQINSKLHVVADLAGKAFLASTSEDYLIPSAILNATISGLISRSILNKDVVKPGDFHACIFYRHLANWDLSQWFASELMKDVDNTLTREYIEPVKWDERQRLELSKISQACTNGLMEKFEIGDRHRIKPGIGEATRALLRRVPDRIIVRDYEDEDIYHIILLAKSKGVPVECDRQLPYKAVTLIKTLGR